MNKINSVTDCLNLIDTSIVQTSYPHTLLA